MKRFIITLAAVAMTCGAMFAQNRGDIHVGPCVIKTDVPIERLP